MPVKRKNEIELNLVNTKKPKQKAPNPTKLGVKQSYQIKVGKKTLQLNEKIQSKVKTQFKKNMKLDEFFKECIQYTDIFEKERIENTQIRQGTIQSLMVLEHVVYGLGGACKSDRECIKTLLSSNLL